MSSWNRRWSTVSSVMAARRSSPDSAAESGQIVEGIALHVDHIAQLLGDVVVDPAKVVLLQPLLAALTELLHHLPQALHLLAIDFEALLEEPPKGGVDIAVVEEIVVHLGEQVGSGEVEPSLGAVPAGVGHPVG